MKAIVLTDFTFHNLPVKAGWVIEITAEDFELYDTNLHLVPADTRLTPLEVEK